MPSPVPGIWGLWFTLTSIIGRPSVWSLGFRPPPSLLLLKSWSWFSRLDRSNISWSFSWKLGPAGLCSMPFSAAVFTNVGTLKPCMLFWTDFTGKLFSGGDPWVLPALWLGGHSCWPCPEYPCELYDLIPEIRYKPLLHSGYQYLGSTSSSLLTMLLFFRTVDQRGGG